ncbi:MAG: DEAD/DEAH box helicase [Limisphaerales bacterium]|nr:MAG: DEAD/DEAH box helicase [Limisphaerales bacterium]KAG0508561.1 MAG: DEAD/DEAH box helicase [Limisphaerales bacterium]TXT50127.1 MAG: DEAD/DEAH box helicase [Limisphaerales bacterium]
MSSHEEQSAAQPAFNQVTVPDLWQQQAVTALRAGKDVVVHAPTGSGKTLVFELWSNFGKPHGQAIYTVPTRALANDKLAEWRARGWHVGIATGDLSENLDAPILVATLETQKYRLIRGDGPALLVIDEYQMLADGDRGLNYELAIAMAPPQTRLLLLSGSVENPHHIVKWLERLGRKAQLVRHLHRPVPLEEVHANDLSVHVPSEVKGYWPRLVAKALADDLGPVLIFAPRRKETEALAGELARFLPNPNPLTLTTEQKSLVGEKVARMLRCRVAYHHSGMSYGARAGVVEPLTKAGQLRVVVATMGLAAGINFSLRSVALAAASYRRDGVEIPIRPDEILQMFGRAGRRGIDEIGYVLVSANGIRLLDGRPAFLARSGLVDWSALLGIMGAAAQAGLDPFREAVRVQERLFTTKPILLGVEGALKNPDTPCGLKTDGERARHVRKMVRQFLNSRGEWETWPALKDVPASQVQVMEPLGEGVLAMLKMSGPVATKRRATTADVLPKRALPPDAGRDALPRVLPADKRSDVGGSADSEDSARIASLADAGEADLQVGPTGARVHLRPALMVEAAVEKLGEGGTLVQLSDGTFARSLAVADVLNGQQILLAKWVRKFTNWGARQVSLAAWREHVVPVLENRFASEKTPVVALEYPKATRLKDEFAEHVPEVGLGPVRAVVALGQLTLKACVDTHGVALWKPPEREVFPEACSRCPCVPLCKQLPTGTGVATIWRRLGLVDAAGVPTRRGRIVSFFHSGDGLAVAAALEDESLSIEELSYELANLHAGHRFAKGDARWDGRIALACRRLFGPQTFTGYLDQGVPPEYGAGAEEIAADVHRDPLGKNGWTTDFLGIGDIDRMIIEWRSVLRQIAHAPDLEWPRWEALKDRAKAILRETDSPTLTDLPPLEYAQTKRVNHQLSMRRH